MTKEELVQEVKSMEKGINKLLLEARKMGLKVEATIGTQPVGHGFRGDLHGYEPPPMLLITFAT